MIVSFVLSVSWILYWRCLFLAGYDRNFAVIDFLIVSCSLIEHAMRLHVFIQDLFQFIFTVISCRSFSGTWVTNSRASERA
jgi:hypothetical protein